MPESISQAPKDAKAKPREVIQCSPLHACMIGLVLLNLVFVQLTEATSGEWLGPLYALTIASPVLARFKENLLYRSLWNLGVIGFFVMLIQHAMDKDLAYVLQDGLILAVLCQVHLLNNLHADQRPDLLFLNSYLIAIITGYITVDLGFAAAFLLYAPFYVIGLQFLSVMRPGRGLGGPVARAVLFDGMKRSGVLIALSVLAFMFWPRDFQREALFVKLFEFEESGTNAQIDFSESLDLDKTDGVRTSEEVAMTIKLRSGSAAKVPQLWRGATLARQTRNGSWRADPGAVPMSSVPEDEQWEPGGKGKGIVRTLPSVNGVAAKLRVSRVGGKTQRLFLPSVATRVMLDSAHKEGVIRASSDSTAEYSNPGSLRYDVTVGEEMPPVDLAADDAGAARKALISASLQGLLQFEDTYYTRSAIGLAERLRERESEDAGSFEIARSFSTYLHSRYRYALPGEGDTAETLHEFLTTDAGGHCEFFSSALATMLRAEGIPCRVVTGYRAHLWDEAMTTLTVRAMDAHAWVEVWDSGAGWRSFDPTPAADTTPDGPGVFDRFSTRARELWVQVTGFDGDARAALVGYLRGTPRAIVGWMRANPMTGGLLLVGTALGLVFSRQRRRRRVHPSVRELERAFKKSGWPRMPNETPREALRRVESEIVELEALAPLTRAVADHERTRYAVRS